MNFNQNNLSYYLNLRNLAGLRSVAPSIRYIDGEEQSEAYAVHMNESIYLWGCEMAPLSGDCVTISYRPPGGTRFEEVKFPIYQSEYRVVIENNSKKIHGSPNLPLEISKNPDYYSSYFNNELVLKEVTPPGSNDAENLFVKFGESSPIEVIRQSFVRCFRFLKPGYYKITLNESSSALYRQTSNEYPISNPDDQINYEDYLTKSSGPWIASDGLNDDYKKVLKKTIIVNCVDNFDIITDNSYKNLEFDIDSQANYDALYLDSTSKIVNGFDVIISGKKYNDSIFEESKYLIGLDNAITNEFVLSKSDKVLNNYSKNITYNLRNKKFEGIRFHGPAHFVELLKITNNENGYALVDLRGCVFSNCTFDGVSFGTQYVDYLILDGCKFSGCTFNSCEFYFSPQNVSFVQCNIIGSKSASGFFNFNKSNGNIIIGCNFANVVDPIKFTNFSYTISQITEEHDHRNNIILFNSISRNNFINSNSAFISVNGENSFNYLSNFSGNMVMSNYVAESMGSFFSIRSASAYANLISNNVSASSGEIIIGVDEIIGNQDQSLVSNRLAQNGNYIQKFPPIGSQAVEWFQSSNYGIQSQFSGFDILLWYDGRVYKIPGATTAYPPPSGIYAQCSVCTLGGMGCDFAWDDAYSFYRRFQLGSLVPCGTGTPATLQQVRNEFRSYFDIDAIVKSQSRYNPDWILAFLHGGSEPLWYPTSIEGLRQWAILADDGLASNSIGLAFNPLEEYVAASNKYKQRIMAYFYPKAWIELDPVKYPFAINMFGQIISSPRHGNNTSERSIASPNFINFLCQVHVELAQKGMDTSTGYGVVGAMWDAILLEYQLDFSDEAKRASGIDLSTDFPWPVSPSDGPIYSFASTYAANGNVQSLLIREVNDSLGWTAAIKNKLQAYVDALILIEKQAVASIRNALDQAGYSDFVLLQGGNNSQPSFEWPSNGEAALVHGSGVKIEIGVEGYRYRRQPSNISNIYQRDAVPDFWLAQHLDMLLQQGAAGKRQYAWQMHVGPVYFSYGGSCGSEMATCLNTFDAQYADTIEFRNYIFPREMAVRGWLENQSLLSLASYCSPEFMHNYLNWHKFDNSDNLLGFENNDGQFAIQHLPYMRRIYSILGSIKESNVYLSQRGSVAWCVILHKPELGRKSVLYSGYPGSVYADYYWPMIGALHTCVEHGVPHVIVHDSAFSANRFSNTGVIIVPFDKSGLSSAALYELSQFSGTVIYMQDELVNGSLTNNFHNTSMNGSMTYAKFSRNMLWDLMLGAVKQPYVKANYTIPSNYYEEPVPLTGYEHGYDIFGNESMIITMAADVSWHDSRKGYLFDQTYNNDPTQGIDYCGRQNLLLIDPNSNIRIEEAAPALGLRKVLDNCGECSNRDCFYVDYSGSDPIPETALPARGKLVYYAGYPPTWDSLRKSNLTFNSYQQPYRVRQLLLNKDSGRFDPIDYFINSSNFDVIPYEIGSILQVQFKNPDTINRDLGICINSALFKAKNHLQLSSLFSSIASNGNAVNLVKVKLKCGTTVRDIEIAGNIIFNELSSHAFNNPSFYEWIDDDPCGFAAPSDYAPIGFIFSDSSSCASGSLSVSGIVIQNEGICNIALNLPSLRADALAISEVPCACGSDRPSKFYSSRASISLDYTPQDGSLWAAQLDQELLNNASNIDGLLLFIKPDTDPASRYYNVDANGLPFYKGIVNYLDDIGAAIIQHSNGAKSIYDYYYGLVLDFAGNFDINNNSPHPRYCAYPNAISILNTDALANTQREIANINGAYIDLIREIKFAYSNMKVSIRGIGQFGNGLSLEANVNDQTEYSLLDSVAEVRLGLSKRISESYGPIIEKCDFIYVQNDNTIRGDSYRISVIRTNAMISVIRNHFVYVNGVCPEVYVEVNGLYTGSQDAQNENYCEINSDEIIVESVASFYRHGVNGFVYNAVQETVAKEVFGNCPISITENEYYNSLISCYNVVNGLEININYLQRIPPRIINSNGISTSIKLNEVQNEMVVNRFSYLSSSYEITTLTSTGEGTVFLKPYVGDTRLGWDLHFPTAAALRSYGISYPSTGDPQSDAGSLNYALNPVMLDLNNSYMVFLHDNWPENRLLTNINGTYASSIQKNPTYYKYPIYDEIANQILGSEVSTFVHVSNHGCVYINKENDLLFQQAGKIKGIYHAIDPNINASFIFNIYNPILPILAINQFAKFTISLVPGFTNIRVNSFDLSYTRINYMLNLLGKSITNNIPLLINSDNIINNNIMSFSKNPDQNYFKNPSVSDSFNNYKNNFVNFMPKDDMSEANRHNFMPETVTEDNSSNYNKFIDYLSNYFNLIDANNNIPLNSEYANNLSSEDYEDINLYVSEDGIPEFERSGFLNYIFNVSNLKSVRARGNCIVTIDDLGSLRIAYTSVNTYTYGYAALFEAWRSSAIDSNISLLGLMDTAFVFYSKEEIENNFWIDSNGLVNYLENKDFVDCQIYGDGSGGGSLCGITFIYALHKNGKIYGREMMHGVKNEYSSRLICKFDNTADIAPGDILYISTHDLNGKVTLGDPAINNWLIIHVGYDDGICVLQTSQQYAGYDVNYNRPYPVYVYDEFKKVNLNNNNTYKVIELYYETSYLGGIGNISYDSNTGSLNSIPEYASDYIKISKFLTKIEKIPALIGSSLNPEFLTLLSSDFHMTFAVDSIRNYIINPFSMLNDPYKKIYKWSDSVSVKTKTRILGSGAVAEPLSVMAVADPNPNGFLYHIQMGLSQISNNDKVIKIAENNIQSNEFDGISPIFLIKDNRQANHAIYNADGSFAFYSYSYHLCVLEDVNQKKFQYMDTDKYNILNPYIKEKVYGYDAKGNYTQIGWSNAINQSFDSVLYNAFVYKNIQDKISYPTSLSNYYVPIRCISAGSKSLCLLNNDGECVVINAHKTAFNSQSNVANIRYKNAVKGFGDFSIENTYSFLPLTKQYWFYNRGSGYIEYIPTSYNNYTAGSRLHLNPMSQRNIYKNSTDPDIYGSIFIYNIVDNSLTVPIVNEDINYGLGNPPANNSFPMGIGLASQQLDAFKTFNYSGSDSIHDISKDINYMDIIFYKNFNNQVTGSDVIMFKVSGNYDYVIDNAYVNNFELTVMLSNGVVDKAYMGATDYSYPVTRLDVNDDQYKTYLYKRAGFDFLAGYPGVFDSYLGAVVPSYFRQTFNGNNVT